MSLQCAGSITTMLEVAECILRGDEIESGCQGLFQGLLCPRCQAAQPRFELRKCLLDRRQIRRIGGQEPEFTATCRDQATHPPAGRRAAGIHDHTLAWDEGRCEHLLPLGLACRSVGCPWQPHRCPHPGCAQRRNQRRRLLRGAGHMPVCSLATWCTGVPWGEVHSGSARVHHHESMAITLSYALPLCLALLLVALGGTQRLVLRVQPSRLLARAIARVLSCTPCACSPRAQWVARVASGSAAHCAHRAARCSGRSLVGHPGDGLGVRSPVSRRCASSRLIVARLTPNIAATSRRGMVRSTAVSTRSRRSTE